MLDFKGLEVWKASRVLTNSIYTITKEFPKGKVFGLTQQIRKSAVSVSSNIAEGIGRNRTKGTVQFLYIAKDPLLELESQLVIASDQKYLSGDDCKKLLNRFIYYHQSKLPKH